jgi:hypothetical protein
MLRANADDALHVGGVLREHHGIGRLVRYPGERVAVLFAHGLRRRQPIAEGRGERINGGSVFQQ